MTHLFMALTNAIEGKEDAFNAWYDDHHLREVLLYGRGFTGGRRYQLEQACGAPHPRWNYLALYTLESEDLAHFHANAWIPNRPALTPFTGLLADDHVAWVYTPAVAAESASWLSLVPLAAHRLLLAFRQSPATSPPTRGPAGTPFAFQASPFQRTNQPAPPWQDLALFAVPDGQAPSNLETLPACSPQAGCSAAWLFRPIGEYLDREHA